MWFAHIHGSCNDNNILIKNLTNNIGKSKGAVSREAPWLAVIVITSNTSADPLILLLLLFFFLMVMVQCYFLLFTEVCELSLINYPSLKYHGWNQAYAAIDL